MTSTTAAVREVLRRWGGTTRYLSDAQARIDGLSALLGGLYESSRELIAEPSGRGGHSDPTARLTAAAEGLRAQYEASIADARAKMARAVELQRCVEGALERLSRRQYDVISARYAKGMSWQNIAVTLDMSARQAQRHEARAVERLRPCVRVTR